MPKCENCSFRVRGEGHKDGPHHGKGNRGKEREQVKRK